MIGTMGTDIEKIASVTERQGQSQTFCSARRGIPEIVGPPKAERYRPIRLRGQVTDQLAAGRHIMILPEIIAADSSGMLKGMHDLDGVEKTPARRVETDAKAAFDPAVQGLLRSGPGMIGIVAKRPAQQKQRVQNAIFIDGSVSVFECQGCCHR
ncbi:hypothetical protein [Gluconacetobacter tumulisoli]|uniref:hypothetical protein n=1 Tax=Gluconacetobacter tumulisoli TaxID=1286189 RepID=UPI0030843BBD